jgi:hypothetical protein
MHITDKMFYNKGSYAWYQKSGGQYSFTSDPQFVDGAIVIRQTFPGLLENVKHEITIHITADDLKKLNALMSP